MRNQTTSALLTIFFFSLSLLQTASGQTLKYEGSEESAGLANFTLDVNEILSGLDKNIEIFGRSPYYDAFMIYGDGNYQRFTDTITESHKFQHSYFKKGDYPAVMLLMERKTDTPPPPASLITIPNGSDDGVIKIASASSENTSSRILMPDTIFSNPNDKVAIDFSHHDGNNYYVENKKIVAFPIAFKPDSSGVLLFYFNDNLSEKGDTFSYHLLSEIKLPFNTYLSANNNIDFSDPKIQSSNLESFQYMIAYPFSKPNPGDQEFRIFPLLMSTKLVNRKYRFLAVLYENNSLNTNNYGKKKDIFPSQSIPEQYFYNKQKPYIFQDAAIFEIDKGEPDDPNQLIITDIEKIDNKNHRVTFEMEYCNRAEFAAASGATVVLNDSPNSLFHNIRSLAPKNLFHNYEFISSNVGQEIIAESDYEFNIFNVGRKLLTKNDYRTPCNQKFSKISEYSEDKRFCISISDPCQHLTGNNDCRLIEANRCATFTFSAHVKSDKLDLLWQQSVLKYSVILHSTNSEGEGSAEEYGFNRILNKNILTSKTNGQSKIYSRLELNPIWRKRNKLAKESLWFYRFRKKLKYKRRYRKLSK